MKKRLLKVLLLVCTASFLAAGCGSSGDSGDTTDTGYAKEIYLYNWTEYMSSDVLDQFEEEYGIKVVESTYESNDEMLAKLLVAPAGEYDIAVPSNFYIKAMLENDLLEPYDEGAITNLDNIYDDYLDPDYDPGNEYTVPYMGTVALTIGNTKMLDSLGVEVNKVTDLLNPALKDNVIITDDTEGIITLALEGLGYDPLTQDLDKIYETKDFLLQLNDNIKSYSQIADGRTMLARNEVAVGQVYGGDAVQAMNENEDLSIVMNDEKISLSVDTFVLLKGSEHKEEAQLFIDFLLRPEISAQLLTDFPFVCCNEAAVAELPEELASNPACVLDDSMKSRLFFIDSKDAETMSAMVDVVTEVKSAK
ncbi:MAG: PotD/PotF family extracellular solute-binding protein [Lachnospiraceae bacterium]